MRKRISLILWIIAMELLLFRLVVFAQEKSEIYQVQITYDTSGLHITPCPLPGISGDTWRFTNSTSDTICLSIPMCVGKRDPHFYVLAAGNSVDHAIGIWDAFVKVVMPSMGKIAQCGREHPPACPTLTQWGVIVLVGLIVVSAIYNMVRRKREAVKA